LGNQNAKRDPRQAQTRAGARAHADNQATRAAIAGPIPESHLTLIVWCLYFVGPFLQDGMRTVGSAARPIHEERFVGRKGFVVLHQPMASSAGSSLR